MKATRRMKSQQNPVTLTERKGLYLTYTRTNFLFAAGFGFIPVVLIPEEVGQYK